MKRIFQILILSFVFAGMLAFSIEFSSSEFFSMWLVLFNASMFILSLGKRIDIVSVILLFASAQWLLGPIIAYHGYDPYFRYVMSISSERYFSFVLPAFVAFELGLLIIAYRYESRIYQQFQRIISWLNKTPALVYTLLAIGAIATLGRPFVPASLRFVFFLLGGALYMGVVFYFITERPYKWYILAGAGLMLILESVSTGLFHNMILWLLFIFMYVAFYLRTGIKTNLLLVLSGIFALIIIQAIKGTYRSMIWDTGMKEGKAVVFLNLVEEQTRNTEELTAGERISEMNVRLNQGWIISRIMMNIPQYNDYLGGYTFSEAFNAALVPRFLSPNKRFGGSVFTFELLTGLNIDENTSMGPSLMGESYGNYGPDNGILAMFIIGLVLGGSVFLVFRLSISYPVLFAFIPIIFFQVVKAETDSITVLNHLVKSLVLFIPLSIFLTRKYLQ